MIMGLGIDIVDIDRFGEAIGRHGESLLRRFFTEDELAYCLKHVNSTERLAVRFAAKEAFAKALGSGIAQGIRWIDVAVTRDANGRPAIQLSGKAATEAKLRGIKHIHVSLTHSRLSAAATVILEGDAT